jgi:mannose-6-phosphate isomerase-like protein (cupin superfamily)
MRTGSGDDSLIDELSEQRAVEDAQRARHFRKLPSRPREMEADPVHELTRRTAGRCRERAWVSSTPSSVEGRMITILDLKAEFAKLTLLRGRTPQMTEVERKESGGFATLAPFRDGNIFSARFAGDGAWERHPNGDELVQIVDGSATLHIMTEDGPKSYPVSAGMMVIVPQGTWHRFHSPEGVSLMTATPKPTEHLTVDVADPRMLTAAQLSNTIEEKWR